MNTLDNWGAEAEAINLMVNTPFSLSSTPATRTPSSSSLTVLTAFSCVPTLTLRAVGSPSVRTLEPYLPVNKTKRDFIWVPSDSESNGDHPPVLPDELSSSSAQHL
jgi:hypothetical protein